MSAPAFSSSARIVEPSASCEMPKHRTAICPACGQSASDAKNAWKFVNARGETEWLRCSGCRSYFMNGEYNLENEIQHTQQMTWGDAEQGAQLNQFKQRMYQSILSQLTKIAVPTEKTLLDVGCSYGGFMEAAAKSGYTVSGFDIVPEAVSYVQQHGMAAQCCAQVRDFSLTGELFDVISVLDANIYWPDQRMELKDIFDRLKPGGILVMRIVDKSWMARVGAILQQVFPLRGQKVLRRAVNDHRFSMPASSFLQLLEQTGFRVISASPRGAIHSDDTSRAVKLSFGVGIALWKTLGVFLAPGAIVIAKKP
jgi:2-polyprenyl-3-methyl-5-hydroxy-6-metoxy-1,4-benzoquinol methylase